MNVLDSSALRPCTSCQMCAAVCPANALSIVLDGEGFYRPEVDKEKCVDCGLCVSVCYKFNAPEPTSDEALRNIPVYAATALSEEVLCHTSSGGVADVLASYLTEQGWLCVGCVYDAEEDVARHKVASSPMEARAFRGSKYIQSYTEEAFRTLVRSRANERVAVFGTPCQLFAIDRCLRRMKKRDRFLLVDIYCHGCPSMFVWKKYIASLRKEGRVNVVRALTFRSKAKGWGTYHVGVTDVERGGSEREYYVSPTVNDAFFTLFFSDHVLNEACHECLCRSTLAHVDIRLGDFWGKSYDMNKEGVSIVSCASPAGIRIFNEVKEKFRLRKHSHSDYLPYQSYGRNYHPDAKLRKDMLALLSDKERALADVIKLYYRHRSPVFHLKRHLKNLILRMPASWVNAVKKVYH